MVNFILYNFFSVKQISKSSVVWEEVIKEYAAKKLGKKVVSECVS